jgi:predicted RNase H-like nuclease (RuvC/YqgF family)
MATSAPSATVHGLNELLAQVENLQRERDHFANEAYAEKQKNQELEREFHTLRRLINEAQKPVGVEENMLLRSQYA